MGLCCSQCRKVPQDQTAPLLESKKPETTEDPVITDLFDEESGSIILEADSKAAEDIVPEAEDIDENYDIKQHITDSVSDFNLDPCLHRGYIVKFNGMDLIKYYAILHGATLNLYVTKPINNDIKKHRNIYDMINISQFYDIDTYKIDAIDERYKFGVTFADHFGDFDVEYFMFETELEQNEWFKAFKTVMNIDQNIINHNNKIKKVKRNEMDHLIFCGWILYKNGTYWMELEINNNELLLYRDNKNENKKILRKSINLVQYNKVCMVTNTDNTLFEYGFMFESDTNDTFYCKSKNNCFSWMAHCDYIIINKMNQITFNLQSDIKDIDVSLVFGDIKPEIIENEQNPLQKLLFIMQLYNNWMAAKVNFTFNWFLNNYLNINYIKILNDYHLIIFNENNIDFDAYECRDGDTCQYLRIVDDKSISDCVLFELLQNIHAFIYHQYANEDNSKFMLDINMKDIEEHKENRQELMSNNNFIFGEDFTYYSQYKDAENFVEAKFLTLKEELLKNPFMRISVNNYYAYYLKAFYLSHSQYIKNNAFVKNYANICNIQGIEENDRLSINHLLCLLIYCNNSKFRQFLIKNCRKNNKLEGNAELNRRHSFVANFRRYLFETCFIFGDKLGKNEFIFHCISKEFIFNSFDIRYFLPVSMTSNENEINNDNASCMILKLEKTADKLCRYFDMKFFSKFAYKTGEKLICGVNLKINDICIQNKWHSTDINALRLFELILKGNLFYFDFNKHLFTTQIQSVLLNMIENYLKNDENYSNYFQNAFKHIFNGYIFGGFGVFICFQQISLLNDDLLQCFFDSDRDDFKGKLFVNNKNIKNIQYLNQPQIINVTKQDMKSEDTLFDEFKVVNAKNEPFIFYVGIEKQQKDDPDIEEEENEIFNICLYLKQCPPQMVKVKIIWDFVCKELQFENINKATELQRDGYDIISNVVSLQSLNNTQSDLFTFIVNIKVIS